MPLWLRPSAGLTIHRLARASMLPSIVELPESTEQDSRVDDSLASSGFVAPLDTALHRHTLPGVTNSLRDLDRSTAAPRRRQVAAAVFATALTLDSSGAQPPATSPTAAGVDSIDTNGEGPPLPRRHWRSFRRSVPVCVLVAVLCPRISLPLVSLSLVFCALRTRSGTTFGTTLRSHIRGVVSGVWRILVTAWKASLQTATGVVKAMGTVKSKPVVPEADDPQEIPLHSLLKQFISDEAKDINVEMLDVTTVLLQSALATCMRLKERRSVMQCRVCWDEEIKVVLQPCKHACLCSSCCSQVKACPICRVKISGRDEFILS
eukprot:TRINITY_DN20273_c0_g1_i1.p1 TRINITY_DN20273_c0_g1~~TRINITY_DN20273_c0_g1_i1.p1  ORF type:complete len:320 (+),score=29.05 TRINITY_DN20273_c0_g1_i1:314-1273(+)